MNQNNNEVIVNGSKLKTDIPFSSWKAFESLMNRKDKAHKELNKAREKFIKLSDMVDKRAKYLRINQ